MKKKKYNLIKAYFTVMLGHLVEVIMYGPVKFVTTQSETYKLSVNTFTRKKLSIT
ncbi:hypothetical protein [Psychrobacillus sp. L3]|uniref:hypothetical protein n=1 Tax=Psychrobacillus sp. L3 TaxID=3236891 RepID=UPI0036F3041A